jgi:catechol 2,3-dioxygenase-like lactoylglutathione lyase family enzyme
VAETGSRAAAGWRRKVAGVRIVSLRGRTCPALYPWSVADEDMTSGPSHMRPVPAIVGVHHVRVPVSDVMASRDWYAETLGLSPILVTEEDTVTGVVMGHPSGVVVGLHLAPEQAKALEGFAIIGLAVIELDAWLAYLDGLRVAHSGIVDGHLGECLHVSDPDGLVIELHTRPHPSADEA